MPQPRVLLIDRFTANPYSAGLVRGLRQAGAEVISCGPRGSGCDLGIFPRTDAGRSRFSKIPDLAGLLGLAFEVLRRRPDVVHVQYGQSQLDLVAMRIVRTLAPSAARVLTLHNPVTRRGDRRANMVRPAILEAVDRIIVLGPGLRDVLAGDRPDLADRIRVVEHGGYHHVITGWARAEARTELGRSSGSPLVAFIGQLAPRKGLEDLIECLSGSTVELVVAGTVVDSDYLEGLRSMAAASAVEVDWRVSADPLPQADLDLVIAAANQVVLPFRDASQSGSVILAMTHGRCVVTTAVGELPRTVGGRGIVIETGDRQALRSAIGLAASDPAECDRLGRLAREYAESALDWNRLALETIDVYAEVIADPAGSRRSASD